MKSHPYGEGGIFVDLEIDDAPDRAAQTHRIAAALRARLPQSDVVVGAGSIAIVGVGVFDDLEDVIAEAARAPALGVGAPALHRIAVVYDGPDLAAIAERTGLSTEQVARVHASREYVVELLGFLPGFGYLSGLDPRLVVARRDAPRPRVAAGSVAVAGPFTGIYPAASPGGWHLLGRALDAKLFDPRREPPSLLQPGDRVRFEAHG
jgi:KipI family sensor histidine kinase inhibitor